MNRLLALAIATVLHAGALSGQDTRPAERAGFDLSEVRAIPVLHEGRYKPFDAYAREIVTSVTGMTSPKFPDGRDDSGKEKERKVDPVALYLDWVFNPALASALKQVIVEDPNVRRTLRPDGDPKDVLFSVAALSGNPAFQNGLAAARGRTAEQRSTTDTEYLKINLRMGSVTEAAGIGGPWDAVPPDLRGGPPMIPPRDRPVAGVEFRWGVLANLPGYRWPESETGAIVAAWTRLRTAWIQNDAAVFAAAGSELRRSLAALEAPTQPDAARMQREVAFNVAKPFEHAAWYYFTGFFLAVAALVYRRGWFLAIATIPVLVGLAYHAWGLNERTALSERALIGNLYESLLFVSAAAAIFGLAFEARFRSRWCLLAGSLGAWLALRVAIDNPLFLEPGISRLRPVLVNNFWIHIHVPMIMASYAALGLTVIMGHVWLIMAFFRRAEHPEMKAISRFVYWMMIPGVILLFGGMILGGVWADASWGRFWGWDPKETWAFITWVTFVILIHGRWAGFLRDFGTSLATIAGGFALVYTYYGVNFFQRGLHSYAGASSDSVDIPMWLLLYVAGELVLAGAATVVHLARRGHTSPMLESPTPATPSATGARIRG